MVIKKQLIRSRWKTITDTLSSNVKYDRTFIYEWINEKFVIPLIPIICVSRVCRYPGSENEREKEGGDKKERFISAIVS